MRGMPSPLDFEVMVKNTCSVTDYFSGKNCFLSANTLCEPVSVLDSRIPSGPTSSSTLSSSLGGGGAVSADTAGVATVVSDGNPSPKWQQDSTTATSSSAGGDDSELLPVPQSFEVAALGGGGRGRGEKCAMEDWECVLSESTAASLGHEQSIFGWIMGDVEDPANNGSRNKFLQFGTGGAASTAAELDFGGGFGVMDQAFAGENFGANFSSSFSSNNRSNYEKIDSSNLHQDSQNIMSPSSVTANSLEAISFHHQAAAYGYSAEFKPPQLLLHQQHQAQPFFMPFSYAEEQEDAAPAAPPAKRLNSGALIPNARQQGMLISRQQLNQQQQLQLLSHHLPKTNVGDELQQQQEQAIIDHLYKAAELLQAGNPTLAQGILARLNHQLSPMGKPFHRAALYCKEALQLLLHSTTTTTTTTIPAADSSPLSLALKIGAYKSFSEVSPIIDFTNFTCNQAILEVLGGFDRIHIVDFDIGYGGQWASLMQELALRSGGAPVLRITAMVSPATHNQLELCLTRENLIQFANEINIEFELEFMSIDSLRSGSWSLAAHPSEAVAVNLPVGCLTDYQLSAPQAVGFIKQLSPRVVVAVERGCDRAEVAFPKHMIQAVQWYSRVLESLEGAHGNVEAIERLVVQPGMEKVVVRRFGGAAKWEEWRSVFASCGLSPVGMSSWTELQAEWVVKRSGVGGFEVERRQSSLVLCWQRRELLSASVWRCST